jgi:hypothetical protein
MLLARMEAGKVVEILPRNQNVETMGVNAAGEAVPVHHSYRSLDLWSDEELRAIGLQGITREEAPDYDPLVARIELQPVGVGDKSTVETWKVVPLTKDEKEAALMGHRARGYGQEKGVGSFGDQLDEIIRQIELTVKEKDRTTGMGSLIAGWQKVKNDFPK